MSARRRARRGDVNTESAKPFAGGSSPKRHPERHPAWGITVFVTGATAHTRTYARAGAPTAPGGRRTWWPRTQYGRPSEPGCSLARS